MNPLQNNPFLLRRKDSSNNNDVSRSPSLGRTITIPPGKVEEASHWMEYHGDIDLSELTFMAASSNSPVVPDNSHNHSNRNGANSMTVVQSFLDIAIFETPEGCISDTCDLAKYGIGKHNDNATATTAKKGGSTSSTTSVTKLCESGRLIVDHHVFNGFHTQLMIPFDGKMPKHVKRSIYHAPHHHGRNYEVIFANCNPNGRTVHISGQVVFEYYEFDLTFQSGMILVSIAFSICLLLMMMTVRIRRGTVADYYAYHQVRITADEPTTLS
jgi:hypothetical protein